MTQQNRAKTRRRRFTRRRLLKYTGCAALAGTVGSLLDAFAVEPRWIEVTNPEVNLAKLPEAWDGLRMAHLTDLHVGRLIGVDYVRRVVKKTNAEHPDVVVLTGDYVSCGSAINDELAAVLAELRAPGGLFGVLGNHDHWTDASRMQEVLEAAGVTMLTNTHRILDRDGSKLCLAGVGDLWCDRQFLGEALAGVDVNIPRILLCHNPDYSDRMPATPRVDLMLSGHTHGGQVNLPLFGRPRLPIGNPAYSAGLASGPRCPVYTSVGLGMVGVPVRFRCRPEVAIVTLRRE